MKFKSVRCDVINGVNYNIFTFLNYKYFRYIRCDGFKIKLSDSFMPWSPSNVKKFIYSNYNEI